MGVQPLSLEAAAVSASAALTAPRPATPRWRHLVSECNLRGLLGALKDYFLLGRGEVRHALTAY